MAAERSIRISLEFLTELASHLVARKYSTSQFPTGYHNFTELLLGIETWIPFLYVPLKKQFSSTCLSSYHSNCTEALHGASSLYRCYLSHILQLMKGKLSAYITLTSRIGMIPVVVANFCIDIDHGKTTRNHASNLITVFSS